MSKEIKGMPIGYDPDYNAQNHADSENNPITVTSESEMITKDFNFVNVDFYIEYQIVCLLYTSRKQMCALPSSLSRISRLQAIRDRFKSRDHLIKEAGPCRAGMYGLKENTTSSRFI